MGGAMNLDEAQRRHVASLHTGKAVVFAEGMDRPYLVDVPNFKGTRFKGTLEDNDIAKLMQTFYDTYPGILLPLTGCRHCSIARANCNRVRDSALRVAADEDFKQFFSRYFLSTLEEPAHFVDRYHSLTRKITQKSDRGIKQEYGPILILCTLLHAIDGFLDRTGQDYGADLSLIARLQGTLGDLAHQLIMSFRNEAPILERLKVETKKELTKLQQDYEKVWKQDHGPYEGCIRCQRKCLYRYQVETLVADALLARDFAAAIRNARNDNQMWINLTDVCLSAAQHVMAIERSSAISRVALCYAAQKAVNVGLAREDQRRLVNNISEVLGMA